MRQLTHYKILLLSLFLGFSQWCAGQNMLSGTVFDTSKVFVVPGVEVFTTSGNYTVSDTLGNYSIQVMPVDSVYFLYQNKYTQKFPIAGLRNLDGFNISLLVKTDSKYKVLNSVTVYSKSYKQDSLAYRQNFSQILDSGKPTLETNFEPGGAAGVGIESLIEIFQFRKNRSRLAFKDQLEREEQERYIEYRFSPETITRITGLKGNELNKYRKLYKPTYEFVSKSTLTQFYTYILQTSYKFKRESGIQ